MKKGIDLTNKCGSCCHFKSIEDTAAGECLQNPYDDSVVHDPKHPHWIVQRSRIKCPLYNAKSQTNADRIRAMSDEELAHELADIWDCHKCSEYDRLDGHPLLKDEQCDQECEKRCLEWLKQPAEGEDNG